MNGDRKMEKWERDGKGKSLLMNSTVRQIQELGQLVEECIVTKRAQKMPS